MTRFQEYLEESKKVVDVWSYYTNKKEKATFINKPFKNDDGDMEVGIKFSNGKKGYAIYNKKKKQWEVGEGDFLG